jgi:hypothetical protein
MGLSAIGEGIGKRDAKDDAAEKVLKLISPEKKKDGEGTKSKKAHPRVKTNTSSKHKCKKNAN